MVIGNFSLTYRAQAFLMNKSDYSEERRIARRFEVTWAIAISGKDRAGERFDEGGTLQNLSSRGAFFFLAIPVRRGAMIVVEIRVPMKEKSWMQYTARVVRVKKQKCNFGVAVNFATARPTFIDR
jgi:hypothetical protein